MMPVELGLHAPDSYLHVMGVFIIFKATATATTQDMATLMVFN